MKRTVCASLSTMISLPACARYPSGGTPPIHIPFFFEAAILSNPLFSDHTPPDHDWGYDAVQLFAVKSKYGTPQEFKEFVKQCHLRQIAVIVDVVYNHLVENNLLREFGGFTTPEIPRGIYLYGGDRADTGFGPRPDYGRPQLRQYIIANAL